MTSIEGILLISAGCLLAGSGLWLVAKLLVRLPRIAWKVFKGALISLVLGIPTFIFLVSPLLISFLLTRAATRPADSLLTETPASFGVNFRDVEFPSRDGLTLRGWLLEGAPGRPTIIACHGLFRSRQELLERSCRLSQEGFSVLLFDFRSHGKSEKDSISLGLRESLDVLGAYDFLNQTQEKGKIVLTGVSMGAVAALHAAGDLRPDLEAVLVDSPFLSLRNTIVHHTKLLFGLPSFPFTDLFVWNLARINGYQAEELDTLQAIRGLEQIPILMLHGQDDRRIPLSTAQRLFRAIPSDRKKMVVFPGAGHGAAYRSDPKRYLAEVVEFLGG
ncbi:MAG: alpha/beta fold hydrolase [Acidobacteriota bacterium]